MKITVSLTFKAADDATAYVKITRRGVYMGIKHEDECFTSYANAYRLRDVYPKYREALGRVSDHRAYLATRFNHYK